MVRKSVLVLMLLTLTVAGLTACAIFSVEDEVGVTVAQPDSPELPTDSVPAESSTVPADSVVESPEVTPTPATGDLSALNIGLEVVVEGLETPVAITHAGDGSGWLFVIEKIGRIRIIQDGELQNAPYLDITDRVGAGGSEQGLLGLAFHPDYAQNGYLFVNYTDRAGNTVVSRFQVSTDPAQAVPSSEEIVLQVLQPAANHNGGHLVFGPDGNLYIGLGDGGGSADVYRNGQNKSSLLGAMLRINVDSLPYQIPADNPFTGDPGVLDEIWAYGLRNPWRYSFDALTGDLYIADVGQNTYEEVSIQAASSPGGENYGWPIMEGQHCFSGSCEQEGLSLPLVEYTHSSGCSITGGYVYRGADFPALWGVYIFGDYCSGRLWGLTLMPDGQWAAVELLQANLSLSTFGEDETGELYLADMRNGVIYRIFVQ